MNLQGPLHFPKMLLGTKRDQEVLTFQAANDIYVQNVPSAGDHRM